VLSQAARYALGDSGALEALERAYQLQETASAL